MVVLLDTSAIYALADQNDLHHREAMRRFEVALEAGDELLVHNYILVESLALLSRRKGFDAARRLLQDADTLRVEWVDEQRHRAAVQRFQQRKGRVSFVNEVSFVVMEESGIKFALAFDSDFERAGFRSYPPA